MSLLLVVIGLLAAFGPAVAQRDSILQAHRGTSRAYASGRLYPSPPKSIRRPCVDGVWQAPFG